MAVALSAALLNNLIDIDVDLSRRQEGDRLLLVSKKPGSAAKTQLFKDTG